MSKFKTNTGYFINKDIYSAVNIENLWMKLSDYVDKHSSEFSNVSMSKADREIKMTTTDFSKMNELIRIAESDAVLDKRLIRTCLLNTTFSKEGKCLILSNENTENFEDYNEVIYHVSCSEDSETTNSLFFHDSALENYTKDNVEYSDKVLALVSYEKTVFNSTTNNSTMTNEIAYVCYNTTTNTLENEAYPILNEANSLNVEEFISKFNSENPEIIFSDSVTIGDDDITITLSNFRISITMFKMTEEFDFLNFKSCVPMPIYNDFIKNAENNLQNITF